MALPELRRRRVAREVDNPDRGIISDADRKRPVVRATFGIAIGLTLVLLVLASLGPLLWLAKSAVSPSLDIVREPLGWFPSGEVVWSNLTSAWVDAGVGRYLGNTLIAGLGSVVVTLFTCVTAAYVLSVLRPKWGPALSGAILAVLFIPFVVSLVPVYKTILELPVTGGSLLNTYWAVWLPAGANAFGVLIVKRFFDSLPRELFEAARIDGAGPLRVLTSVVLPLSRPILGVLAILTLVNSYKDFLWPSLVLVREEVQPISVALVTMQVRYAVSTGELMAALFISVSIPIALFLVFQRQILSGVSAAGGIKG